MDTVKLKIECYCLTRANHWSTFPFCFEFDYPASKYMKDLKEILFNLLKSDDMINNFCRIKLTVLNENESCYNHDFMIYLEPNKCVIIDHLNISDYRDIKIGDIVRHFKYETISDEERAKNLYKYKVLDFGYYSETNEKVVIYQALYEPFKTYVRLCDMFMSEVSQRKYPGIKQVFRFVKDSSYTEY